MLPIAGLRDRIITSVVPRMAATHSFESQPRTSEDAIFSEGVFGVVRATWFIAAAVPYERG